LCHKKSSKVRIVSHSLSALLGALLLTNGGKKGGPDVVGGLGGIDGGEDALLLVVLDDRDGLGVVGLEPLLEGVSVVVSTLDEGLASDLEPTRKQKVQVCGESKRSQGGQTPASRVNPPKKRKSCSLQQGKTRNPCGADSCLGDYRAGYKVYLYDEKI